MDHERRKAPRIDVGKINHETFARVIGITTPWAQLTLRQRAAYAAAAAAVIQAYEDSGRHLVHDNEPDAH